MIDGSKILVGKVQKRVIDAAGEALSGRHDTCPSRAAPLRKKIRAGWNSGIKIFTHAIGVSALVSTFSCRGYKPESALPTT